jgi:cobalt-zinc-cadmium efflux system protein
MKSRHSHAGLGHAPSRKHAHDTGQDHARSPAAPGARTALSWALVITVGMAAVEAVGGYFSGSLALLSDAGHMATDAAALGLALFADWIARRPPSRRASYGYARAEVLAAFVNALALLALVVFITVEAVRRLLVPAPVSGGPLLTIAIAGLIANLVVAWILSRAGGSLNARGALLHVLSDVLGSVAAIVAGAVILTTDWTPIDPILSIVVALLIVRSTWRLLAQSTGVLMEGVPAHLDYDDVGRELLRVPGIAGVHDLHIWQMGADRVALSAHVALADGAEWPVILARSQRALRERFGIDHVTLQPSWPSPVPHGDRRVIPITPHNVPSAER